ncbi:dihydrofolate reductase family protein [Microbacteriaceae bacterium VKM Ac-2855]|nr:dihydrofolate reductase family protein [Microbacteriaceae bacterium VKM Ac-2855]
MSAEEDRRRRLDGAAADAIGVLVARGTEGPTLAAHALRAGLVDEIQRFVAPVVVGGGTPVFPPGLALTLAPREECHYDRGISFLPYDVLR